MYLLDESNKIVDAEFSLDLVDSEHCIVVESSGGSNPKNGTKRRNPEYNKLLNIILSRLATHGIRITQVILDSQKVSGLSIHARIAHLDIPYPVELTKVSIDEFRKMLGRAIAAMHRDPKATHSGNSQKRIRICLNKPISPDQLVVEPGKTSIEDVPDGPPGQDETERQSLRAARRGQGKFRDALLEHYSGACPVTGISNLELLIASHIKPWSTCTNIERLDPHNGILLSAMIDRLFDRGLITFADNGSVLVSPQLSSVDRKRCGLDVANPLVLTEKNKHYLAYHREIKFKST